MLNLTDIRIDHYRVGKNYIRAEHIPTGISVQVEGEGYLKVREEALHQLELAVRKRHG